MALEFLDPYSASKLLKGVIPANKTVRPNWLQTFFGNVVRSEEKTLNFDKEFDTKNVMGMFVAPTADVDPIQLEDFGHQELSFSYSKEGLNSPDYDEISVRRLGQPIGQVDPLVNELLDVQAKLAKAEQRFENLFEYCAAEIIVNGGYTAASEKHPKVVYNFGRTTPANANDAEVRYLANNAPYLDLSTLNGNGGVGKRAWDSTGGTTNPTPYKDVIKMASIAAKRGTINACVMSTDAYDALEDDINTNYKDAANMTLAVANRIELHILPIVKKYQDLNYRRTLPLGNGTFLDVFTYEAVYHQRGTGVETLYYPLKHVSMLPSPELGVKVYGRIMHPRARYAAMPRWLNYWENPKTGKREWEEHTSFIMGHTNMDSVVTWKVML